MIVPSPSRLNVSVTSDWRSGVDFQATYALPLEDWGVDDWGNV